MIGFVSMVVGCVVGAIPHFVLGDRIDIMTDFLASTVLGGAAYIGCFYQLKKMQTGL